MYTLCCIDRRGPKKGRSLERRPLGSGPRLTRRACECGTTRPPLPHSNLIFSSETRNRRCTVTSGIRILPIASKSDLFSVMRSCSRCGRGRPDGPGSMSQSGIWEDVVAEVKCSRGQLHLGSKRSDSLRLGDTVQVSSLYLLQNIRRS